MDVCRFKYSACFPHVFTTVAVNSPQSADEAVDGSLCIQGHDIPDMQETGGRVRHPAADSSSSDNKPQVEKKRNFLLRVSSRQRQRQERR